MKKSFFTLLSLIFSFTTTFICAQNLSMTPEKITSGEQISLTYNPQGTPLEGMENILATVYFFDNDKPTAQEVAMTFQDGTFSGTFKCRPEAKALLFAFTDENFDKKDNQDKKGYKTIVYQSDRKTPVKGAYASKAFIVGQFGWLADLDRDNEKAVKLLKKEFDTHPASADNLEYQVFYAAAGKATKDESIVKASEEKMNVILKKKKPTEEELNYANTISAQILKNEETSKQLEALFLKNYPKGSYAANQQRDMIRKESDLSKKVKAFEAFNKNYSKLAAYEDTKNYLAGTIAATYGKEKDWENFRTYFSMISDNSRKAGMLNSMAWPMSGESLQAEAKDAEAGKKLSKESLELLEAEMKSMKGKPDYMTEKQYLRNLKGSYAMFADTYALLAYKTEDYNEAFDYQKIACENNKFGDGEMNQRYTAYFEKVNNPQATEKLIAEFIAEGKASSMMKEQHKRLYMANNTLESAYDKYLVELEKSALVKMREEVEAKMLHDMVAPNFALVNLAGEQVSLESLKGKVVVVDFWATWCGPCKASFPGMQKAVNKFENSTDVEFVFIDTWESGTEKETNASKFINSKNYTFNVLMDNDNKVVADFGVSGIPTKFVLDKNGNIRFKSVGFGGNDEELVNELSMMIELAGGTIPTPETGAP